MLFNCENCQMPFEKDEGQAKRTKHNFCSRSCANSYNNKIYPKRKKTNKCKQCTALISSSVSYCKNCWNQKEELREDVTIKDCTSKTKDANRYSLIRQRARKAVQNDQKTCQNCGYNKFTHVCHKKDIASFDPDTKLSIVNDRSNLAILCPNCHAEFDNGLLTLT